MGRIEQAPDKRHGVNSRWVGQVVAAAGFLTLMASGVAALHLRASAQESSVANPPITVLASTVSRETSYAITERFAGRLEPSRQAQLAFERSGLITEMLFEEGDTVLRGDVIARLDISQLDAERLRLLAQRGEIEARRELAAITLARRMNLKDKGWQTEQSFDEARFGVNELESAIARLDASISLVDIDLGKSLLRAPFDGRVAARNIDEGAVISPGAAVVELLESGSQRLRIGVSVEASDALAPEKYYRFGVGEREFDARLIAKRPDIQTRTRTVTALFETEDVSDIPFGEIVELSLIRDVKADGYWIPVNALTEGRKGLWSVLTVTSLDDQPRVAREAVEVLHVTGERAFVSGTLTAGAEIIVSGTDRVIPGQLVAVTRQDRVR